MNARARPSTRVQQVFGDATLGGAEELAAAVGIIFLSVKPQYLDRVLEALKPHVTERHLVVSIAAGVRIASLEANLPERARVVRTSHASCPGFKSPQFPDLELKLVKRCLA